MTRCTSRCVPDNSAPTAPETEWHGASIRGCRQSHRHWRQSRLAGELSAQPGARVPQLFQGWLVGKPPFQGRWRNLPDNSDRDLEDGAIQATCCTCCATANPVEVYLFQTPSRSDSGLWTYSAYANDSWRMSNRLTLNLGLRFDRYRVFLPEQAHPAGRFNPTAQTFPAVDNLIDWNVIAPRIGLVHDLAGDGKTIAKLSYGQYWLAPGTDLGFNANPNSNQWWQRYTWSDPTATASGNPAKKVPCQEQPWRRGARIGRPGTRTSIRQRVRCAGSSASWLANVGVRTGVVWRGERQHYMRQNVTRPFDAFTVPVSISDPGPDGRAGTADDGPAIRGYDLRPESCGAAAPQHRPQCARRRQPLLDVGDHGDQAPYRAVVAGGRLRAHLEPRPGERILRSVCPQQRLSADAERPDQCWQGWTVRVPDLVGQDSRHVRRAMGRTDHTVSAPSVRAALRAHVRRRH